MLPKTFRSDVMKTQKNTPKLFKNSLRIGVAVALSASMLACGAPKRGESELEYKNRLAKYTIAGVLIGGYLGTYHTNSLPLRTLPFKLISVNDASTQRVFLSLFYTALGGYAGHSLVKHEGAIQRLLFKIQNQLAATSHQALVAEEMGQAHSWSMPEQKATGQFRVTDRYTGSEGFACQDLVADVSVDGANESVLQTACQNPAGQWVLWTRGSVQG